MRCRVCNAYVPEGATHCIECGTSTEPALTCQKCGTEAPTKARFCRKCGEPLSPAPDFPVKADSPAGTTALCPRCGAVVGEGVVHCPVCGTNQEIGDQTQARIEPEPTPDGSDSEDAVEPSEDVQPCPRCGTVPRGEGRFCYHCGRFLDTDIAEAICASCGAANTLRYSRCQYCGANMPKSK